ncbi:hypothetical protein C2134_02780 [Chromobacterium sinusclupearum]|uniref:Uncharacterized protein n=1 Tax=Chromobacterium sinusclupearum TaxID=2077146 RepID=A0A2K4MT35_9NEIS|nr:hypothetical protein [Chromobacterium sinusclupearum]POB00133.1 hypothetical protein C2134_02780 [Chromobacterium sinusclupearum]
MARQSKLEKMHAKLNEEFRGAADEYMLKTHAVETKTEWSFAIMQLVTNRVDGLDFTPEQMAGLRGYSDGYAAAMNAVYLESVNNG